MTDLQTALAAAREALEDEAPTAALDAVRLDGALRDLLAALDAAQPVDGMAEITRAWNAGYKAARIELGVALVAAAKAPPAAVPAGYALVPVAELSAALNAVNGVMQDAYNRGHQVCCGQGYGECCGNSIVEWEPADDAIMSGLQPVHATLSAMLAALAEKGERS